MIPSHLMHTMSQEKTKKIEKLPTYLRAYQINMKHCKIFNEGKQTTNDIRNFFFSKLSSIKLKYWHMSTKS